jgi:hypothetical protein
MNKRKSKSKMNLLIINIITSILVIVVTWYWYNFVPYEVNIEFVEKIELVDSYDNPDWQVLSLNYYIKELQKKNLMGIILY